MSLFLAFLADLCFGDPHYDFHPIRLMGKAIERGETFLRRNVPYEKLAGTCLALLIPLIVFLCAWLLLFWAGKIHFLFAAALNIFGIYTAISIHDLKKEADKVFLDLKKKDIERARQDLAGIVGRDTDHLDEREIVRATVETVAESTVDGVIAPLFYAAIGGAPLALAYKAVNTLDSMIGHWNERYREFGFFAAKQDTLINWLPARLSYLMIGLASFSTGRMRKTFSIGWKHGIQSGTISAIPEAAFAGALGVQLGGRNQYYGGQIVDKPFLGEAERPLTNAVIQESVRLMIVSSWLTLICCLLIHYGWRFLWLNV